eukprot:1056181-Ditylum_brightwellii.AAC.1
MQQEDFAPLDTKGDVMLMPQSSAVSQDNLTSLLDATRQVDDIGSAEFALEDSAKFLLANQVVGAILTTAIPAIANTAAATAAAIIAPVVNESSAEDQKQVLGAILEEHFVAFPGGAGCDLAEVDEAIENLGRLIQSLQDLDPKTASLGRAP